MAEQSPTSADLWLLEGITDFREHALKLCQTARRDIIILSQDLDTQLYEDKAFINFVSQLARSSRNAQIKLLIKNTKPAIASGHQLIRLAQRLSSKIFVRKLVIEPDNKDMGFMCCDTNGLLYKNDDGIYKGFANYHALREVKQLREQFNYIWQYAEQDPELQILTI
jgi:hypothetical protein